MEERDLQEEPKKRRRVSTLLFIFLMLVPLLFCCSQAGLLWADYDRFLINILPDEIADYSPWVKTPFAPVDERLLTQLAIENGAPTIPPTLLTLQPEDASEDTNEPATTEVANAPEDNATAESEEPTDETDDTSTETDETVTTEEETSDTPAPTDTLLPTDTLIPTETELPPQTLAPTETPIPTETVIPTETPIPTDTTIPTATLIPTETPTPTVTSTPTDVPIIEARFNINPNPAVVGQIVNFRDRSNGVVNTWAWDFGDGTTSTQTNPSHTYTTAGTYTITLVTTGPAGTDTATRNLNVSNMPLADLSVTIAADRANALDGDQVTFTITANNNNTAPANNTLVTLTIPTGVTVTSANPNSGTFSGNTWTVGTLTAFGSSTMTLVTTVNGSPGDSLNVRVDLTTPVSESNLTNNRDNARVSIINTVADIEVTTSSNVTLAEGETGDTLVSVTNVGTVAQADVQVLVTIPTEIIDGGNSGTTEWATAPIASFGTLAPGETKSFFIYTYPNSGTAGTTQTITLQLVNSSVPDQNPTNNLVNRDITVVPGMADLSIVTFSPSDPTPSIGEQITVTLTIRNDGPSRTDVVVNQGAGDVGLLYISHAAADGTYDVGTNLWTIPNLTAGQTATIVFTTEIDASAPAVITRTREILSSSYTDPDSIPNNGVPAEDDHATYTLNIVDVVDIAVAISVDNAAPTLGDTIRYTIDASKISVTNATGVAIQVTLPPQLSFAGGQSASAGSYNSTTGVWTLGNALNTSNQALSFNATVDNTNSGNPITTSAALSAVNENDNNVANNSDSVDIVATLAVADLEMTAASLSPSNIFLNDTTTLNITVANNESFGINTVSVTNLVPAGFTYVSHTESAGTFNTTTGIWNIGTLGGTATATLTLTLEATDVALENSTVSYSPTVDSVTINDSLPANNSRMVTVAIGAPVADVEFTTFAFDNTTPGEGDTINATLVVTNQGPSIATNVVVGPSNGSATLGTVVGTSATKGTYNSGSWTIPSLTVGETVSLTITIVVDAGTAGTTISRWREIIAMDQTDPDSTPNNGLAAEDDYNSYSVSVQAPPVASFTFSPDPAYVGQTVSFVDATTGNTTSYAWDFGDTNASTLQNPTHSYATSGTYTVSLTASGPGGNNTTTASVTVLDYGPVTFSASATSVNWGTAINYNITGTGGPATQYIWEMGDGNAAGDPGDVPSHAYTHQTIGSYNVRVGALRPDGTTTWSAFTNVSILVPFSPNFTMSANPAIAGNTVTFTDTSSGGSPNSWTWDFGDGNSSNQQSPTHAYGAPGTYTVTFTIGGAGQGSATTTQSITVNPAAPSAGFSANQTTIFRWESVTFTDSSSGVIDTRAWDFGDGGTSSDQSPSYTFNTDGTFTVTLTVSNVTGNSSATETITVQAPSTGFSSSATTITVNDNVTFSNGTTGPYTGASWDFGGEGTSTEDSPTFQFTNAGTFTVTLTITRPDGSTETASDTITVNN